MRWFALWLMLAGAVFADGPLEQAERALVQMQVASEKLSVADASDDRIAALTDTVQAFEEGLGALREGIRQAKIHETHLRGLLAGRETQLGALLAALVSVQPGTSPDVFLHPQGVTGAARAGMLVAEITPALTAKAQDLQASLEDLENVSVLQRQATATLENGLREAQDARLALHEAVAQRTDLPFRFISDPVRAGLLIAATDTLDSFASGLSSFVTDDLGWQPPDLEARAGDLPFPVRGTILRYPGETDAAGITRPGIVLATRPGALVTNPISSTLRYAGPLLDMGLVVILEPRADVLFVFAGLDIVYGEPGQILPEGAPLGLMGGLEADLSENGSSIGGERGGVGRSETLYIEVRQDNAPQDPEAWFRTDKDG